MVNEKFTSDDLSSIVWFTIHYLIMGEQHEQDYLEVEELEKDLLLLESLPDAEVIHIEYWKEEDE